MSSCPVRLCVPEGRSVGSGRVVERCHAFPGAIYDAHGRSLDSAIADLRQDEMGAYPYRSLVTDRDVAPVALVWLLDDDATLRTVPSLIMADAVRLVLAGGGVLILARRPEAEADVREGLLRALDLFAAPLEEGGRA